MGFATLLEQKYLTNFTDQNGKEAEIVFQYSYKRNKAGDITQGEVVMNKLDQKIPDNLFSHLVANKGVPIFSAK